MKKHKLPRSLEINPQDHEISLSCHFLDGSDDEVSNVHFKFGSHHGEVALIKSEAVKIARFFDQVAKALNK